MRSILSLLIVSSTCLFLAGCSKREILEDIKSMKSAKVKLCTDSMLCVNVDSILLKQHSPQLKLITYVDTSECTSCSIGKLKAWESYISKFKEKKTFQFFVLIEAKRGDAHNIEENIVSIMLNTPILIDSNFVFRHQNPQIPNNSMFHTFLIDESDSVILVGNPLQNERIDKLLKDIVDGRMVNSI